MDFLEKLDLVMKSRGLNKNTLSIKSQIPYTTIDGWYKKGYEGIKLSTVKKLTEALETTLDYFVRDDVQTVTPLPLTPAAQRIGRLYDKADDHDQQTVEHVLSRYDEDKKGIPGANNGEKTG